MSTEIDSLSLKIISDGQEAASALNGLASSLERLAAKSKSLNAISTRLGKLKQTLAEMKGENFTVLTKLAESMSGLSKVKLPSFNSFINGFKAISQIDSSAMNRFREALREIADAVKELNKSVEDGNLRGFISDLAAISRNASAAGRALKQASNSTGINSPPIDSGTCVSVPSVGSGTGINSPPVGNSSSQSPSIASSTNYLKYVPELLNTISSSLRQVAATVKSTWSSAATVGGAFKNTVSSLMKNASGAAGAFVGLGEAVAGAVSEAPLLVFDGLRRVISGLTSVVKGAVQSFTAMASCVAHLTASVSTAPFRLMANAFGTLADNLKTAARHAVSQALKDLPNTIASIAHPLKTVNGLLGKFTDQLFSATGLTELTSTSITKAISSTLTSLAKVVKFRIMRILITNVVNGITTGMQNLYYYGGKFADTMDLCATEMLYLKNSIAAVLAPALNALAPLIEYVVDKFVDFINVVNMLIATLTGASTWTKAVKYPTTWADALDDASSSAKDLRNTLLGFDEINRLDSNTPSSGANGSDALDYSSMFTTEDIDLSGTPWGQAVADMIAQIKEAFANGDWEGVGAAFANGMNMAITALDRWTINIFRPFAVKWAGNIAGIINGAVEGLDWERLGNLVADGLNAIADAVGTFFSSIRGEELGSGIAEAINSLFAGLEAETIGKAIAAHINDGIHIAAGLVSGLDWASISAKIRSITEKTIAAIDFTTAAQTLGTLLGGICTAAAELMKVDFSELGAKIGNAVNSFLGSYTASDITIGDALGDAINGAINGIDGLISTGALQHIATVLGEDIQKAIDTVDWVNLGTTLGETLTALCESATNLMSSINWTQFGTNIATSLKGFISGGGLSKVGTVLGTAMKSFTDLITGFANDMTADDWKDLGTQIADTINQFFESMTPEDWGILGESLNSIATGIISAIKTAISDQELKTNLEEAITNFLDGLDWSGIVSALGGLLWTAVTTGVSTLFNAGANTKTGKTITESTAKANFTVSTGMSPDEAQIWWDVGANAGEAFRNGWNTVAEKGVEIKNSLKDKASTLWDSFKTGWNTVAEKGVEIKNSLKDKASTLWDSFKTGWNTVADKGVEIKNSLKDKASTLWDDFKEGWGDRSVSIVNSLKNSAADLWKKFKEGWSNKTLGLKITYDTNVGAVKTAVYKALGLSGWPKISFAARGGIVNAATLMGNTVVGEAGTEAIVPLENHTEWIDKVADQIGNRISTPAGKNQPIQIICQLNGREVGRAFVDYIVSEAKSGRYPLSNYI